MYNNNLNYLDEYINTSEKKNFKQWYIHNINEIDNIFDKFINSLYYNNIKFNCDIIKIYSNFIVFTYKNLYKSI